MPARRFTSLACVLAALVLCAAPPAASAASDIASCADERVKTAVLPESSLAAMEAACGRVLASGPVEAERQKALFFRGLARFLQVVQKGADLKGAKAAAAYAPPTLDQVRPALADVEQASAIDGPLKGEALSLRITINQTIGRHAEAQADIDQAVQSDRDATPLVQRALERERAGDLKAALADLDRALEIDPKAGTALFARGRLLRRIGFLARARADLAAAAALGAPFRGVALVAKSEIELRAGDLKAAYDDLVTAAREPQNLPKAEAAAARADLFVRAADLAFDKLKEPDAAETLYREAAKLAPKNGDAALGLARVEEKRGRRDKAAAIYKRILKETRSTPQRSERLLASYLLKRLTDPLLQDGPGPFRSAFESAGVAGGRGSPDGLKRIAFIIGLSEYAELASLPNARRDAAVMASALSETGFDEVEIAEDLGAAALRSAPAIIAERAAQADVALVFYAGHGVETGGANYLLPVDATIESDQTLKDRALALAELTAAAAKARRGALVIVDACRDDPFVEARGVAQSRGSGARSAEPAPDQLHAGLAAMPTVAANSVVFHSTQPGQVALDGEGLDSPFVQGLLQTLGSPGLSLDGVVRDTSERVSRSTDGKQIPAFYGAPPSVALLPPAGAR